jgi:hypothetical protein
MFAIGYHILHYMYKTKLSLDIARYIRHSRNRHTGRMGYLIYSQIYVLVSIVLNTVSR